METETTGNFPEPPILGRVPVGLLKRIGHEGPETGWTTIQRIDSKKLFEPLIVLPDISIRFIEQILVFDMVLHINNLA
jgi:hypothetical protein